MTYSYSDIRDKSKEGMDEELQAGLTRIAVFFQTTHGLPLEIFNELNERKFKSKADQWLFYMSFRNDHPSLFE